MRRWLAVFLLVFLPLFLAVYYLTPMRWRSVVILLGSYAFYAWWRVDFLSLFIAATLWNYGVGLRIQAHLGTPLAKRWLAAGVTLDLLALGYFKYADFGLSSLNSLLVAAAASRPRASCWTPCCCGSLHSSSTPMARPR